jgi:hypothetical protein
MAAVSERIDLDALERRARAEATMLDGRHRAIGDYDSSTASELRDVLEKGAVLP